ncbi:hypothetical protein GBA52_010401, partial [Prunus armeniaca]
PTKPKDSRSTNLKALPEQQGQANRQNSEDNRAHKISMFKAPTEHQILCFRYGLKTPSFRTDT